MSVTEDTTTEWQKSSYIAGQAADARVHLELEAEGMTLNIGPQHPATHGTLRIVCRLDGEQVLWADPVPGYMHRGYEKLCEVRKYPQINTLVNRIDWLGSFANEVPFILAAEQLMGIEAPERAQYIRTILFELARIANITLLDEHDIVGLTTTADRRRVTGARVVNRRTRQDITLSADLVLDATGRGARTPAWLTALGYERPAEVHVPVHLTYASQCLRMAPDALHEFGFVVGVVPGRPRGLGMLRAVTGSRYG